MTRPGTIVPAQPGWWVRSNRVGVASGSYGWAPFPAGEASLVVTAELSASGTVPTGGTVTGDVSLAVTAGRTATGTVTKHLTLIGVNTVSAAGYCTIPAHQSGDLIVVCGYYHFGVSGVDMPTAGGTIPQFYYIDHANGANLNSMTTAYAVATASNHTTGIWGFADNMAVVVLRGHYATPIGGHAESGGIDWHGAVAPSVSMTRTDGTSILLHFFGRQPYVYFTEWNAAPSGYTKRSSDVNVSWGGICVDTKNSTTSDGLVTQDSNENNYAGYRGATVEIRAH